MPLSALADPRAWAMDVLGFPVGSPTPTRRQLTAQFRLRMRSVHPDHGGSRADAAKAMHDLAAARKILSEAVPMTSRSGTMLLFPGAGSGRDQSTLVAVDRAVTPAVRLVGGARRLPVPQGGSQGAGQAGPVLMAAVREELAAIGSSPQRRCRRALDGRADLLDGRRRGRRAGATEAAARRRDDLLSAAPAGPARTPARRAPARTSPCRGCSSTAHAIRSARPTSCSNGRRRSPAPVTHHWLDGGHDLKGKDAEVAAVVADWVRAL